MVLFGLLGWSPSVIHYPRIAANVTMSPTLQHWFSPAHSKLQDDDLLMDPWGCSKLGSVSLRSRGTTRIQQTMSTVRTHECPGKLGSGLDQILEPGVFPKVSEVQHEEADDLFLHILDRHTC